MSAQTPAQFAAKMNRWAHAVELAGRQGTMEASIEAKRMFLASIAPATGGDLRLSGVGRRGARVGVRFDVKGTANPTSLIRATGPLQLVEGSTRPHLIAPKTRGRQRRVALKIPGSPRGFAVSAQHPGTSGKRPWARALPVVKAKTVEVFGRAQTRAMERIFTGGRLG